jgi:hypothetical protein
MRITKRQLRRIIKEAIGDGFEEMKAELEAQQGQGPQISLTEPTGRVEVEWDFFMDDDVHQGGGWNDLSYEEQEASEGIPPVIDIAPGIMEEFHTQAAEYGESQAQQLITDWLSDEYGWLHQGWSWV